MAAMRDYIIDNTDFTEDNCVIEDVGVFNVVQMMESPKKCIIVGFNGALPASQVSDFGSLLIDWGIVVNAFFLLQGSPEDRLPILDAAYTFLDDFLLLIIQDSTLGSQVMDARLVEIEPPMTYTRNDMSEFMLLSFKFALKENL